MANGLVVSDTSISVGGRAVLGANLGRVQIHRTTHTSDTVLATQAAGGTAFCSSFTAVVPTVGIIKITVIESEYDITSSAIGRWTVGIKVGSDAIDWAGSDDGSGDPQFPVVGEGASSVAGVLNGSAVGPQSIGGVRSPIVFDIATDIGSTGSQTIQLYAGKDVSWGTGNVTITGTTTTAVCLVEVIDGS